jgi:hypothetical protein
MGSQASAACALRCRVLQVRRTVEVRAPRGSHFCTSSPRFDAYAQTSCAPHAMHATVCTTCEQLAAAHSMQLRMRRPCQEFSAMSGHKAKLCNVWVFCADPSGNCWSADIWPHETGECWLKHQRDWDGNQSTLVVNARGKYSARHRQQHATRRCCLGWQARCPPTGCTAVHLLMPTLHDRIGSWRRCDVRENKGSL